MKKVLTALALLLCVPAWGQVAFPLFQPSDGIMVGDANTYVTSSATVLDVTGLFTGICDATTFLRGDGECAPIAGVGANPTAQVGLTAVNGSAATFMRSDAAPGLDVTISPTWMGNHTFTNQILVEGQNVCLADGTDCTVLSGYATLAGDQTFSGNNTFSSLFVGPTAPIEIRSTVPGLLFYETDAATDEKSWSFGTDNGVFGIRARADDGVSSVPIVQLRRTGTGTAASDVEVYAPTLSVLADVNTTTQVNIDNDNNGTTNAARVAITSGDASTALFTAGSGRSTPVLTGGPTGAQGVLRTLGNYPIVFGTSNTYRGEITGAGTWMPAATVDISNTSPTLHLTDTDYTVDNRKWRIAGSSGVFILDMCNDAVSTCSDNAIEVAATSSAVSSVALNGTDITLNGTTTVTGGLISQSNVPTTTLYELDAGADEKNWTWRSSSGNLVLSTRTDAGANVDNVIIMTRSGTTMTGISFGPPSVQFSNITTTASAANAFLDSSSSNRLYRSTSSIRYKKDVEAIEAVEYDKLRNLRPITYHSKAEADDPNRRWFGLIAEEVAEVYPELVNYDAEGRPDGVQYERLTVLLLGEIQRLRERVEMLETAN